MYIWNITEEDGKLLITSEINERRARKKSWNSEEAGINVKKETTIIENKNTN